MESRASELFQLFGLNEREALVYLTILKAGSASAGEVAKSLSLRRMEAYRLVKKLADANVIRANAGKPVTYSAQPVDEVVSSSIEAHSRKGKAMEAAMGELLMLVRSMPRGKPRPSEQQFKIIQGREQVYGKVGRMADDAKDSVSLLLTKNDLIQAHQIGLVDKLVQAAKRGVKVGVLSVIDEDSLEAAEALQKKCELRHSAEAVAGRLVLQDRVAALTSLVLDDSRGRRNDQDIAVSTESPNYVEMLASLFGVAYRSSVPSMELVKTLVESKTLGERVRSLAEVLQVTLPEDGWQVSAPGAVPGRSGATHPFPVLGRKGKRTLAVDIVAAKKEQDSRDRSVVSVMKKLDLDGVEMVIVSTAAPSDDVRKLARLMGVGLVYAPDTVGIVGELRRLVQGGESPLQAE